MTVSAGKKGRPELGSEASGLYRQVPIANLREEIRIVFLETETWGVNH